MTEPRSAQSTWKIRGVIEGRYLIDGIPDDQFLPVQVVSLDDPRLIETLAAVIENRHGTLHGIGSTLREALAELKRGQ